MVVSVMMKDRRPEPEARKPDAERPMSTLRLFRMAAGLTQEQVASRVGVSLTSYWKWETGACMPSSRRIPRMAKVLGVTPLDLIRSIDADARKPEPSVN